jgi:hypothetical protein
MAAHDSGSASPLQPAAAPAAAAAAGKEQHDDTSNGGSDKEEQQTVKEGDDEGGGVGGGEECNDSNDNNEKNSSNNENGMNVEGEEAKSEEEEQQAAAVVEMDDGGDQHAEGGGEGEEQVPAGSAGTAAAAEIAAVVESEANNDDDDNDNTDENNSSNNAQQQEKEGEGEGDDAMNASASAADDDDDAAMKDEEVLPLAAAKGEDQPLAAADDAAEGEDSSNVEKMQEDGDDDDADGDAEMADDNDDDDDADYNEHEQDTDPAPSAVPEAAVAPSSSSSRDFSEQPAASTDGVHAAAANGGIGPGPAAVFRGILSNIADRRMHVMKGKWAYESHHPASAAELGPARNVSPARDFEFKFLVPGDQEADLLPQDGPYNGSFSVLLTGAKKASNISEKNVSFEYTENGEESNNFILSANGTNRFGVFNLTGTVVPSESYPGSYEVILVKMYNTAAKAAPPLPAPSAIHHDKVVCLRGDVTVMNTNLTSTHTVKGFWSTSRTNLLADDPEAFKALCNPFELEHKSTQPTKKFPGKALLSLLLSFYLTV